MLQGIFRFVAERNSIDRESDEQFIKDPVNGNIISEDCAEASKRIWGSFCKSMHLTISRTLSGLGNGR